MAIKEPRCPIGYSKEEITEMLKELGIPGQKFWEKFGVNTMAMCPHDTARTLYYRVDVKTAIRCCVENRNKRMYEWD